MPTDRVVTNLGIGATNPNILAGSIYASSITRPTRVTIAAVSDQPDVGMGVQFGSRSMAIAANMIVPEEPAPGVGPNIPDQVIVDDVIAPLENLVVSLQGGAIASVNRTVVNYNEG